MDKGKKEAKEPSFFLPTKNGCLAYKNVRDKPDLCGFKNYGLKNYVESLWEIYRPHADRNFRSDACNHFQSRFWEMYLGVTFIEHGFKICNDKSTGPEFYLENGDRRIWIEAVAPGAGGGPDAVPAQETGVAGDAPINEFILRLRHAIEEKWKKYEEYIKKNIVDPDDIYIIGINTKNIALIPWDSEIPAIFKTVYPFGNQRFHFDKNNGKAKKTSHEHRDSIEKKSGSPVSTDVFLDPDYAGISAVIYSHVDCANKPKTFGADFVLVHNAVAKNNLNVGTFKFGRECWIENEELNCIEH